MKHTNLKKSWISRRSAYCLAMALAGMLVIGGSTVERRASGLAWLAAERRAGGAAERRAGGAAEQALSGAAERVWSGAAEQVMSGAAERRAGGAAERRAGGAAERRANTILGSGQEDSLLFVWWNVQNLFDTLPNSGERDRDFLPEGIYRWNSMRYYSKLYAVGRGLAAAAGGQIPDAIGVCEIENADVLDDLERRWPPAWRLWRLHRDSPDQRGIDVAVWYNPERLRVDSVAWIHPEVHHPTREALWIRFQTPSGKTLTWLWAHLPSQRAPSPESRSRAIETILKQCSPMPDGITGDLNEGLEGPLSSELRRQNYESRYPRNYPGTYAYRGRLEALDGVWIQKSAPWTASSHAIPFGLQKSPASGYQIKGSFQGTRYRGGASDHLPLRIVVAAK